jgi:DNA-binding NtrC family response regulator
MDVPLFSIFTRSGLPIRALTERLPTFKEALQLLTTKAMLHSNDNQIRAARMLGISRSALSKRLKKLTGETPTEA